MPVIEFNEFVQNFNLIPGNIYEILLTTVSKSGELNTAPFGVRFIEGEETLFMKTYEGSTTLSNLLSSSACIINIVFNPFVFFSTMKLNKLKHSRGIQIVDIKIDYSDTIHGQLRPLDGVNGYIIAETIRINSDCDPNEVYMKAVKAVSLGKNAAFCRARAALIEMMIYLSRMDVYIRRGKEKNALTALNKQLIIVKKTGCKSWISLAKNIVDIAEKTLDTEKV